MRSSKSEYNVDAKLLSVFCHASIA